MALSTNAVKGRIKSVQNTKKITKAMEMIAAVKMRKAVAAAVSSREYAHEVEKLLQALSTRKIDHPLAEQRKVRNKLVIMITSDRGLCGSYNARVLKAGQTILDDYRSEQNVVGLEILALGRKSAEFARRNEVTMRALYEKLTEAPDISVVHPIAETIMQAFLAKEVDAVEIIYTRYISGMQQEVEVLPVLPVVKTEYWIDALDEDIEYEPNKKEILNFALPMLTEVRLFQALLESIASEHSSRMIAMKNASESAGDLIDDLKLQFNKARQAAITTEIAEISAGAEALG